jgi:CheY-like chemotaxis protein
MTSEYPKSPGDQRGAVLHDAPDAPRTPKCIVIIEDDTDTASSLAEIFELEGHAAHVALNGEAGIEVVQQVRPDVVFCDIGLPGIDGFEVARALRNGARFEGTLVAFTGHANHAHGQRCIAAGFNHHLPKPADIEQLIEIIMSTPSRVSASR